MLKDDIENFYEDARINVESSEFLIKKIEETLEDLEKVSLKISKNGPSFALEAKYEKLEKEVKFLISKAQMEDKNLQNLENKRVKLAKQIVYENLEKMEKNLQKTC